MIHLCYIYILFWRKKFNQLMSGPAMLVKSYIRPYKASADISLSNSLLNDAVVSSLRSLRVYK